MRPTIDEQLAGAARLLRVAETDHEVTPAVAELVRNARRLVERVTGSWATALPFLREDNDRMATILDVEQCDTDDLAAAARRNEELRAALTRRIHELPRGPERTEIGALLRDRVDADPT